MSVIGEMWGAIWDVAIWDTAIWSQGGPTQLSACVVASDGGLLSPVATGQTWASHFAGNGWNSPQDQITAGYPMYIQPAVVTNGYYEEIWDYGSVLPSVRISAQAQWQAVAVDSPTVVIDIAYKTNSGDAWTTVTGESQIYAVDVRYVKVTVHFLAATAVEVAHITALQVTLDALQRDDAGLLSCSSGDTGGTTGTFAVEFVDVQSITATPVGTVDRRAVAECAAGPNPTTFVVLLFDSAGTRVSGDVYWSARGT